MNRSDALMEERKSDFSEFLKEFNNQLDYMGETSNIIFQKLNTIKNFDKSDDTLTKVKINCNESQIFTYMDEFNSCIDRIRFYNTRLNEIKLGLIDIVG